MAHQHISDIILPSENDEVGAEDVKRRRICNDVAYDCFESRIFGKELGRDLSVASKDCAFARQVLKGNRARI